MDKYNRKFLSAFLGMLCITSSLFSCDLADVWNNSATKIATGLTAAGLVGWYAYKKHQEFRTPGVFEPTVENLNSLTLTPRVNTELPSNNCSKLAQRIYQQDIPSASALTINGNNICWGAYKGISLSPDENTVFLYSRGIAQNIAPQLDTNERYVRKPLKLFSGTPRHGGGMLTAYSWIKHKVINGPVITFDYPDDRNLFDFALSNDSKCLEHLYQELCKQSKEVVLMGNCRGAKALLNFASTHQNLDNVKALFLESPIFSLEEFTNAVAKNYTSWFPFTKSVLPRLFKWCLPNYNPKHEISFDLVKNIPADVPIFIAHLQGDSLCNDDAMRKLISSLKESGHTVYCLVVDCPTLRHARLSRLSVFQKASNAFFKKYGLPHNETLAQEGELYLHCASLSAQDPKNWIVFRECEANRI